MTFSFKKKLVRKVFFTAVFLFGIAGSAYIYLDWQLRKYFPADEIVREVKNWAENSDLAVVYESAGYRPGSGFVIQRLKVSSEPDFSAGKVFLEAPVVTIPISIALLWDPSPKLVLRDAEWTVYLEQDLADGVLFTQLQEWLKQSFPIPVQFTNNSFKLFFEKTDYQHHFLLFEGLDGSASNFKQGGSRDFRLQVNYDQNEYGSGTFKYSQDCSTECNITDGKLSWVGKEFPLSFFNSWMQELQFIDGYASGESNWDFKKQSIDGSLRLLKIKIGSPENSIFASYRDSLDFKVQFDDDKTAVEANGLWSMHPFKLRYEKEIYEELPSLFQFQLEASESAGESLIIGRDQSVKGLNMFSARIEVGSNGKVSGEAHGEIKDGEIRLSRQEKVIVPGLEFSWLDNELQLSATMKRLSSKLNFSLRGPLRLEQRTFREATLPLIRGYRSSKRKTIFAGRGKLGGALEVERLNPAQWLGPLSSMKKAWDDRVTREMNYRWMPSRIQDREWFKRWLSSVTYQVNISLVELYIENNRFINMDGFLDADGRSGTLDLRDIDRQQEVFLRSQHGGNVPYYTMRVSYQLPGEFSFLNLWHPMPLLDSFNECSGSINLKTNGELPVHMYFNRQVQEYGNCSGVSLKREFAEQLRLADWSDLQHRSAGGASGGRLTELRLKNENSLLIARGSYRFSGFEPEYKVNVLSSRFPARRP